MNRDKIEELIIKARHLAILRKCENNDSYLHNCIWHLKKALDELSKPDWIPVIEELPPLEESVLVTSTFDTDDMYFSHRTERKDVIVDRNLFATYKDAKPITHWQRIKKIQ